MLVIRIFLKIPKNLQCIFEMQKFSDFVKKIHNHFSDLVPDQDTFIIKIDIQGFECKVNYFSIILSLNVYLELLN